MINSYHNFIKNLTLFFIGIIFISCTPDQALLPIQQNANSARTNSYEHIEFFNNARHYTNKVRIDDSTGVIQLPLALPDGRFVVATKNYGINLISSTESVWTVFPDTNYAIASAMAIDKDENIYVLLSNGALYSYSIEGTLVLILQPSKPVQEFETFSDLLLQDDGIVIGSNKGLLKKYNFNGDLVWSNTDNLNIPKTFCSDEHNNLYMIINSDDGSEGDSLISIGKNGKIKWAVMMPQMLGSKSVVYKNNKIYCSFYRNTNMGSVSEVFCFDNKGNKKWSKQLPVPIRNISIDNKENVIVSGYNAGTGEGISGIFSLKQGGEVNWSLYLKASINAPLLLSNTDVAISAISPEGAAAFFLDKETGKLKRYVSMHDAPILYLNPCISSEGNLTYFGADKLKITTIVSSSVL